MKPELNITEAWGPVAGAELSKMRIECVWCDEAGEPVKARSFPVLRLLSRRKSGDQAA
ncbi:hypothetical protein [Paragemmobacter straminiformis]|uniref:Uncharacterized protein n=1 Tax=Paragemmobacter straminiformis TaxID=2045119 RepID=A0A842I5C6_9RHOB|nr:hypothetical protein [Gemmobacter straminiformis]MBC2834795.1 hypothetical protein [Gemmobacter straminiformis]